MTYTIESLFDECVVLMQAMDRKEHGLYRALLYESQRNTTFDYTVSRATMEQAVKTMPDQVRAYMLALLVIGDVRRAGEYCFYKKEDVATDVIERRLFRARNIFKKLP